MGLELFVAAVGLLMLFAVFDLMVGVSNDAVNFLNSSIGSKAAPRFVIMIIASMGIVMGVTFSNGMMEIARKGIFNPQFFTMPELITIFLAVMLTDVILLDLFNTFGLPTSTTVSIVFELLGAAVAVSVLKIVGQGESLVNLSQYINTSKAMTIILGILLSVIVAFFCGAVSQFFSRLLFTFDYQTRLKRYGAVWGGIALTSITYFILIKGAKGATFLTPKNLQWIDAHTLTILMGIFCIAAIILETLLLFKINILKPIVLIGTFALAMAFAANDLVNFIGVPLAGLQAYKTAALSANPLSSTMDALGGRVQTSSILLLAAGLIMVLTLWLSKKSSTVSHTEISLGQQDEGEERFDSIFLSRVIVRMGLGFYETLRIIIPKPLRRIMTRRFDQSQYHANVFSESRPSFDLLRASVNLMIASAVISYATSYKLPLSTTYVTFMVAMGSSFADRAWGRESAVYRVTGVLTVIGGWFLTAFMAFSITALFAFLMVKTHGYIIILLLALVVFTLWKNHHKHAETRKELDEHRVFNLKHIQHLNEAIPATFEHMSLLLHEMRRSLEVTLNALFAQNGYQLKAERQKTQKIQRWVNIIIANIFKALRLLQKNKSDVPFKYGQTIRRLQKLSDGHRDITARAYKHVSNHHAGLLDVQIQELSHMRDQLLAILQEVESTFSRKQEIQVYSVLEKDRQLRQLAETLSKHQNDRIQDGSSKTRLTILFYAMMGNAMMISKQCLKLLEIFEESFPGVKNRREFEME